VLKTLPPVHHPDLLVGLDWHDDAGVFRMTPDLAVIQTVDYFTPIVDDPFDYGEIAAANSLSDVYAMGGEPVTAMNIVGFPTSELELSILGEILRGGHAMTVRAGAVLLGGHSVKSPELFYGLAVLGRIHPARIVANRGARSGDQIVLTKPIGTGVLTTALKKGLLSPQHLQLATEMMKRLNALAGRCMVDLRAHACTDVTGFGLMGHLYEMTSASGVDAEIHLDSVPLLEGALEHARAGHKPGGLTANRLYLTSGHLEGAEGDHVPRIRLPESADPDRVDLLFDPQTSGGLLISLPKERARELIVALHKSGEMEATIIGEMRAGSGTIVVRAD
jgi:selenide, water dikinase